MFPTTAVLATKFNSIFAKEGDDLEIHAAKTMCLYCVNQWHIYRKRMRRNEFHI